MNGTPQAGRPEPHPPLEDLADDPGPDALAHLEACASCAEQLRALDDVAALLRGAPSPGQMPADVVRRLDAALGAATITPPRARDRARGGALRGAGRTARGGARRPGGPARWLSAAATVAVIGGAGYLGGQAVIGGMAGTDSDAAHVFDSSGESAGADLDGDTVKEDGSGRAPGDATSDDDGTRNGTLSGPGSAPGSGPGSGPEPVPVPPALAGPGDLVAVAEQVRTAGERTLADDCGSNAAAALGGSVTASADVAWQASPAALVVLSTPGRADRAVVLADCASGTEGVLAAEALPSP